MGTRTGAHAKTAVPPIVGGALVAVTGGTVAAAVVGGVIADIDWSPVTRLLFTALVYAPVAAVILPYRRPLLVTILAALALTSAALALVMVLREALPDAGRDGFGMLPVAAMLARQSEIAAIAVLPWLVVRRRRVRRAGYAAGVVAVVFELVAWTGAFGIPPTTVGSLLIALGSMLAAAAMLAGQWRAADARKRAVLAWFGVGAALLVLSYARLLVPLPPLPAALADAAFLVAQSLLPTALLAVVLDPAARRRRGALFTTVIWAQSLAFAAALYLVIDTVAVEVGLAPTSAGAVAAAALALAFSGMRTFVLRHTSRLYFGPSIDARSTLRGLGDGLGGAHRGATGLTGLAAALRAAWGVGSVGFALAGEAETTAVGERGVARITADLVARGSRIGVIEVTGDDDLELAASVAPVLDEVAPLLAVAVLLATVNQEVETVRSRTLGVQREERRMLHRELHDQLIPALAGLSFALAGAERLLAAGETAAAARSVCAIRDEVADRAEDVRVVARTLLPAALDAADLDGALRELARRFTGEGGSVDVEAPGVDVLDSRVQIAVYVAVAEAITSLRRSGCRGIGVAVRLEETAALIRVRVDAGPPSAVQEEVSESLARRVADVGGETIRRAGEAGVVWQAAIPR